MKHDMRVTILSVSLNPEYYDLAHIAEMDYDEAKDYFEHELVGACNVFEVEVDQTTPHESKFHAEGVSAGDGSDTMFNWIKVEKGLKKI